jgi:hypothetical protein
MPLVTAVCVWCCRPVQGDEGVPQVHQAGGSDSPGGSDAAQPDQPDQRLPHVSTDTYDIVLFVTHCILVWCVSLKCCSPTYPYQVF